MKPNIFLEGKKLYLRPVELEDAELLARCNNSPEVRVTFFTNFPTNVYREQERIKSLYEPKIMRDYIPLVICTKEKDKAIGVTGFHRVDLVSRAAIYSIIIANSAEWSRGYGTETTELMVSYGFDILNLNRIQLHVFAGNERAIKAYEKVGFKKEGLLRQAMYHNDEYCDFYVMAILRNEYYERKKAASKKAKA